MPDISKIKFPSGNVYDIVDAGARELIEALQGSTSFLGITSTPLTDGATTNPISVNGENVTATNGNIVIYDKAEFIFHVPSSGTASWHAFGDLSTLRTTVTKGSGDMVLGESTTFSVSKPSIEVTGTATTSVLGSNTTFSVTQPTVTVTPTTTAIKATASGTAVGANGTASAITGFGAHTTDKALGSSATFSTTVTPTLTGLTVSKQGDTTDTFVKSYPGVTSKLDTTTVPNVTGNTAVSIPNVTGNTDVSIPNVTGNSPVTLTLAMGTGSESTTLIISGTGWANNTYTASDVTLGTNLSASKVTLGTALSASKVTLGTAKTVATGSVSDNGGGGAIMTGLGTPVTSSAVTASGNPSLEASSSNIGQEGYVTVSTGVTSASTTVNNKDEVTAITALGTPTTAAALTGVQVTAQPTISIAAGSGSGSYTVVTGVTSATASGGTVTANSDDSVNAVTTVGTAALTSNPQVTVGTEDKVKVILYDDLDVTIS